MKSFPASGGAVVEILDEDQLDCAIPESWKEQPPIL